MQIYRWDLDKTYLQTELGSVRGLLRAAIETAEEKRNVPGSAALLRALQRADPSCRVAIVSGSPTQMRAVLEQKLKLDGIRVDHMVLKDNLRNLRKGRLKSVIEQLGYKLPVLLEERGRAPVDSREVLFGDDAEVDAVIYTLYAELVAGRLDAHDMVRVMQRCGSHREHIDQALELLEPLQQTEAVQTIFIHAGRGTPTARFDLLGERVLPVHSWMQAAWVMCEQGALSVPAAAGVVDVCVAQAQLEPLGVAGLGQDAIRRKLVRAATVLDVLDACSDPALLVGARQGVERLGGVFKDGGRRVSPDIDGFLDAVGR